MNDNEALSFPTYRIKLESVTARDTRPKCKHPDRKSCPANSNGRCIALNSVDFGKKPCPFFRSIKDMSAQEYEEYKSIYKHAGNRGGKWREV